MRNTAEAYRIAGATYKMMLCVICGTRQVIELAHLNQNPGDNDEGNLAWLCPTHHRMFDAGLYPERIVKELRAHWELTQGREDHTARMKGAGKRAATTRAQNMEVARKARAAADLQAGGQLSLLGLAPKVPPP